jgi:AcrR family transcriptional regulator
VHELLEEGRFHTATVDEVADRAGISRATLYQHFRSRLELVDALCDTLGSNADLVSIRQAIGRSDPRTALAEAIMHSVRFWSSENAIFAQLYGVTAIDEAAADFVRRQLDDRRSEIERLAGRLRAGRVLRPGLSQRKAVAHLMLLTSYDTYVELRQAGLSDRELTALLKDGAERLLLAD